MEKHTLDRYALILLFLLFPMVAECAPPTSTYIYVDGQKILPAEVQTNENNIYRYLSVGVDKLANDSVTTSNILDGTITNADISGSAAIPYSKLSIGAGDIPYLKLSLGNSLLSTDIKDEEIVNADISGSAAIALSKLASVPILYADTRCKIVQFTRDISAADGNVSYTGVGFTPTAIIFLGEIDATTGWSIGSSIGTEGAIYAIAGTNVMGENNAKCLSFFSSATDKEEVDLLSFDADGFTLTYTKAGTPSAVTAYIKAICFK